MRGCTGAIKEIIYGTFFLVQFNTLGVKLEDGLDIKAQRPGGLETDGRFFCVFLYRLPLHGYTA